MRNKERFVGGLLVLALGAIGIGLIALWSCINAPPRVWAYRLKLLPTPTPHYAPMTGQVYLYVSSGGKALYPRPNPCCAGSVIVDAGTPVEILDSTWFFSPWYRNEVCYYYHIRVPGTNLEGWVQEDYLTQEKGVKPPGEIGCYSEIPRTPPPDYVPLSGQVYVNVGGGNGIALSNEPDPREWGTTVLTHGVTVQIVQIQWVYFDVGKDFNSILCYLYNVHYDNMNAEGWLPEDALSADLGIPPREKCFPFDDFPPAIQGLDISE